MIDLSKKHMFSTNEILSIIGCYTIAWKRALPKHIKCKSMVSHEGKSELLGYRFNIKAYYTKADSWSLFRNDFILKAFCVELDGEVIATFRSWTSDGIPDFDNLDGDLIDAKLFKDSLLELHVLMKDFMRVAV